MNYACGIAAVFVGCIIVGGFLGVWIGKAIKWGTKGWPGPWTNPMDGDDHAE